MKLPSKIIPYHDSIISKFSIVLVALENNDMTVLELYNRINSKTEDVAEFLEILDCLYGLGKIEYWEESGVLHYVN